ncbi:MAG: hypothetical protein HOG73_12475 [Candidatus Marinimicrobia bacterium]|jgi:hypothetical protein|nr:hypothetical protein [Candidatus Neomarinimicrobiota bacterium]MBT3947827.1 hypothetical protein [Candidatus Neomarinimicrobiota bacterium]MBT4064347.1 hypothetical protein [Candidatus Neomarinimicrobiota bacterium]MBT4308349.1 hypothetical protein [Candidatus Neomarinimicrobiota bacterium]MBT4453609.1 hypothetical protein [Candidatus Neomarinimicrobiota bacterium]|tara:strand:- start:681 stop:1010 length:330 start_codon:yes stop_codon:yes gene_type:complete
MLYDDINVTKRVTITNGKKYDFFIYDMYSLEKELSQKKYGKGDSAIAPNDEFKMLDEETDEMLDVKLRCSKRIVNAMESLDPEESKESKKIFKKCLKELEKRDLVRTKK